MRVAEHQISVTLILPKISAATGGDGTWYSFRNSDIFVNFALLKLIKFKAI